MRCSCGLFFWIALMLVTPMTATAQALPELDSSLTPPPRTMLRGYLQDIADEQLAARRAQIAEIDTPAEVRDRQAYIRTTLRRMMGGLPDQRGPLGVRRTGTLDRGDYRIEKIAYQSRPGFFVTASLYIPQTGSPPYPAVLQPVGHSQTAKARGLYQSLSVGLVKSGFVVLTYDPIGQGERTIFYDPETETSRVGSSTREHQMVGVQSLLAGESVAAYRVWDGMRGIDLLQSLEEVDGGKIGVAGCSGGGTLTSYIAALDDRVSAAAPACYISAWEEQLDGTGPQDAEQQFPDHLVKGLNHGDFLVALAPKPVLICNTTEDFFPLAGAQRTLREVERIYEVLDARVKISQFVGPGGHGMRKDTREAIVAWMNRWLRGDSAEVTEPAHLVEYDEDLQVTATGQVATSFGGDTASTLNIRTFSTIRPARRDVGSSAAIEAHRKKVRQAVTELTRYQPPSGPAAIHSHGKVRRAGYEVELVTYTVEAGRYVAAYICTPDAAKDRRSTIVYVSDAGGAAGFGEGGDADQLCSLGYTVMALDLSGTGGTSSDWGSYSSEWFGADKITWLALMVGRPLVGLRMADVVRGLDVLAERGQLHGGSAHGLANGKAGVVLLHSAAVDPRIGSLLLEDPLVSYRAIAETPIHRRVFSSVVPGVLGEYDLEDLVIAVAPRPVAMLNVRSPLGSLMMSESVRAHYADAAAAYGTLEVEGLPRIGFRREGERVERAFSELVR
jgi:cephalosporin-C deacetylase-like acetyl esterase